MMQTIQIGKPIFFFVLIFVFFSLIYSLKKLGQVKNPKIIFALILRSLAFCALIFATSEISFGKKLVPVKKSSSALCFVFDISYSMLCRDCEDGKTRLECSKKIAEEILFRFLKNEKTKIPVAVVLAKGDGVVTIPLTEDYDSIFMLLENLSPKLMSAQGSALGKSLEKALRVFPKEFSKSKNIWFFTDGDATDDDLEIALQNANSFGIKTSIIGFGSEHESECLSGDGKTKVLTALRAKKLQQNILNANKKSFQNLAIFFSYKNRAQLEQLLKNIFLESEKKSHIIYEEKNFLRTNFFLLMAIAFYIFSIFVLESKFLITKNSKNFFSIFFVMIFFASCSENFFSHMKILKGAYHYQNEKYDKAILDFLDATQKNLDDEKNEIVTFDIATTYAAKGENEAALEKFSQIANTKNHDIRFALNFNSGIVAYKNANFEAAKNFFKNAILLKPESIEAKINFELCKKIEIAKKQSGESELNPILKTEEDSFAERAIFSIVKEMESNQWKNKQTQMESSALDF